MSGYDSKRATRYLPHVAVATLAVVVLPVLVVWWLRSRGTITSPWAGVVFAIALSLAASLAGSAYWKRRRGPRDLLFGELLVWGWLRRVRMERQLAKSLELLRADEPVGAGGQSTERTFRILSQLAFALEAQDAYTAGHSRRVAAHAVMIARRMGLSSREVSRVRAAAAVHDIGKVRVPRDVLDKPGRLTSAEFELVKSHADVGGEIVACLGDPELTAIVRHHHERFDGTGYPSGLAYEQIPLGARIIAVADTFDALTSVRPYRPAVPHKRALEALITTSGTQLDPVAVRAFLRAYSGSRAIVFWSLLSISPQRAVGWLGDKSRAAGHASLSPTATTVGAMTAIAVTAISTPIGPRPGPPVARDVFRTAPRAAAAASVPSAIGSPLTSSHHPGHHLAGGPARRRGHPARRIARVAAANRITRSNTSLGSGSVHGHAFGSSSGGRSSGGGRPQPAGGSSGAPAGGSNGSPGGRPGGRPVGGTNGAAGGGPAAGSGRGSPVGSGGGGGSGSGGGMAGGPTGGSSGGSSGGPSGGSSGTSGTTGASGAGLPSTKDQCKDSGYVQYAFPNQGKCVALVERGPR